jgi:hypothetical protein
MADGWASRPYQKIKVGASRRDARPDDKETDGSASRPYHTKQTDGWDQPSLTP